MKKLKPVSDDPPEVMHEIAMYFFHGIIPNKIIGEDEEPLQLKNTFHWEEVEE